MSNQRTRNGHPVLPLVYVAGPITSPNPMHNTHRAVRAGNDLQDTGLLLPIVPHLTVLADMIDPRAYEHYMTYDLALLNRVDAIYRLDGDSSGADREVAHARAIGLPVFFEHEGVEHLLDFCKHWRTPANREDTTP